MAKAKNNKTPLIDESHGDHGAVWNTFAASDPNYTKAVSGKGYKMTSIDGHYRIKRMTEKFGPCGKGWGWVIERLGPDGNDGQVVVCQITLWYMLDGQRCEIPAVGATNVFMGTKPDDEAHKKAVTDALGKALSYLGMNADIYLGMFEDSKYVESLDGLDDPPKAPRGKAVASDDPALLRSKAYHQISELMGQLNITKNGMLDLLQWKFGSAKHSAQDLDQGELDRLVESMTEWKKEPLKLDALLNEIELAKDKTNG